MCSCNLTKHLKRQRAVLSAFRFVNYSRSIAQHEMRTEHCTDGQLYERFCHSTLYKNWMSNHIQDGGSKLK
jgi:hypothetical protein